MKHHICIFTGARPNFIKVAPLIRAIQQTDDCDYQLVYAGCADDPTLETTLFDDLQIPAPDAFLGVDCENLNELTGRVMSEFERYLSEHETDTVIVVDDLASTMAAAIVTKKRGLRLAHLVAGTRSFDISMPKEINRLVIDGLSDLLFTAGVGSSSIATREGAENHKAISEVAGDIPVIAPLRGRALEVVSGFKLQTSNIKLQTSLSYLEFGYLTSHAMGIITDSGNVAEEATFNHVPCITLNSYTEHIETVKQGSNILVGEDAEQLRSALGDMVAGRWKSSSLPDRWDGRTAERIVSILTQT